jgi:hypothetical protein
MVIANVEILVVEITTSGATAVGIESVDAVVFAAIFVTVAVGFGELDHVITIRDRERADETVDSAGEASAIPVVGVAVASHRFFAEGVELLIDLVIHGVILE